MAVSEIFKRVDFSDQSSEAIGKRLDNMLYSLNEVFSVSNSKIGTPIYSVWIKFQLGDTSNALLFDTTSTIKDRNLIASLKMSKGRNGYSNTFDLEIFYDSFNNGQETNKVVAEQLDDWVAEALSYDFAKDSDSFMTGYIQYGYNNLDDVDRKLYTPIYKFYLTDANSQTNFTNGITHYTFSGVATISADINFETNIPKQEGRPLTVVKRILGKYYGKPRSSI